MLNLIQKIKSIFTKKKKVFEWKPIYRFLYKSYIPNSDNSAKLVIRNAYIRNNKDLVNTKNTSIPQQSLWPNIQIV
jgi:hypothetical protein